MKFPTAIAACFITVGMISTAFSQATTPNGPSGSSYAGQNPNPGSTASPPPSEPGLDDTLYRAKTGPGAGKMLRDEGVLRERPRAREKVLEVDSTKKLPSSGSDPKFQGSLLNLGPSSIDKLTLQTNDGSESAAQHKATQSNPVRQARERDPEKKLEPLSTSSKVDLSLQPEASPTASPVAKETAPPKP